MHTITKKPGGFPDHAYGVVFITATGEKLDILGTDFLDDAIDLCAYLNGGPRPSFMDKPTEEQ